MTAPGPRDRQTALDLFAVAGGEELTGSSATGVPFSLAVLPLPDGSVRVALLTVAALGLPGLLTVTVTAEQARNMGALLGRVADR